MNSWTSGFVGFRDDDDSCHLREVGIGKSRGRHVCHKF